MKRMIKSSTNLDNRYLVSQISSCPFPGMIAFNIIDNEEKEDLINNSEMVPEYVYPHRQLLSLSQGDAGNILEELEEHYQKDIRPADVKEILANDHCSGLIAELDGTLVMIAGHFDRYSAE